VRGIQESCDTPSIGFTQRVPTAGTYRTHMHSPHTPTLTHHTPHTKHTSHTLHSQRTDAAHMGPLPKRLLRPCQAGSLVSPYHISRALWAWSPAPPPPSVASTTLKGFLFFSAPTTRHCQTYMRQARKGTRLHCPQLYCKTTTCFILLLCYSSAHLRHPLAQV
jgi:hypothetical protein